MKHSIMALVLLLIIGSIIFLVNKQPVNAPEKTNNDIIDTDMPLSIIASSSRMPRPIAAWSETVRETVSRTLYM